MRIRKRNRSGLERESEGFIVPLEIKGLGPYFVVCTNKERRGSGGCHVASHPGKEKDATEEVVYQGQVGTSLSLLRTLRQDYQGRCIHPYTWRLVRANGGSSGVDGLTFKAIEGGVGIEAFLLELSLTA